MPSNRFRSIIPGATYFITSVAYKRQRWFDNYAPARVVVDQLKHYESVYSFKLYAYAVMPDHYHAVITPGYKKTISQILHAVHSYTATQIKLHLNFVRKVKIWQGKVGDSMARDEAAYWRMVAYTLLNPWREGLVRNPLQAYPFSNIVDWQDREDQEFLLNLFAQSWDWREFGE